MFDTQAAFFFFFFVSFQLETCANETIHAPVLGCTESGILRSPENEGSTGLGYDVGWTPRGRHSGETSDSGSPPACDGVWDIVRAHPQRQEVEHAWSVEGGEWLPVEAASPFGATRRFQKQIERVHHATDMCLRRLTLHRVALASISEVF